ncbi:MAG: hypothetical protein ABR583_01275 [Gaiellaceae bacterium]
MIDRHYGHRARDGREHAVALLDALAADADRVDVRWTPLRRAGKGVDDDVSEPRTVWVALSGGRLVDVASLAPSSTR